MAEQVKSGAAPELANYAGVIGVDHYYTHQGVPCINGEPHEFDNQAELSKQYKGNFSGVRFMTYRILDAVPYDMVVKNAMDEHPEYFVRWQHQPGSTAPGNGSICQNYRDACFNDPVHGINNPDNNCSFEIRSAAYNFADPVVRDWYQTNIIEPALEHADGIWLDGNGPDNGAYMCSGICCGFGADNSPHNQSEIDSYCDGEAEVARVAHEYLAQHEAYEIMSCTTYLEGNQVPTAADSADKCAEKLKNMAALGATHSKYNMAVAYGDRTSSINGAYDDDSAAGAVAAFMIMRGPHWLMAMAPTKVMNISTARLLTSDYGRPLGNITDLGGNIFERKYENATVRLDCNTFEGTFDTSTTTTA